jgi:hypothetical protein
MSFIPAIAVASEDYKTPQDELQFTEELPIGETEYTEVPIEEHPYANYNESAIVTSSVMATPLQSFTGTLSSASAFFRNRVHG